MLKEITYDNLEIDGQKFADIMVKMAPHYEDFSTETIKGLMDRKECHHYLIEGDVWTSCISFKYSENFNKWCILTAGVIGEISDDFGARQVFYSIREFMKLKDINYVRVIIFIHGWHSSAMQYLADHGPEIWKTDETGGPEIPGRKIIRIPLSDPNFEVWEFLN